MRSDADAAATHGRVFVETGGKTWYGYRLKPQTVNIPATRLNHVAFAALAAALGISALVP